ncbi:MAG TPA: lysophospholipid acyltransferase family protein [Nocardioides sp.]|uniref:lysophospholipid acyltransferase family protein n=1 Tax=Nocardioides sp. TaxID=35761 RepID=UPI002EDA2E78
MATPFDLRHVAVRRASRGQIHAGVRRHLTYVAGLENIPLEGPVVLVANHSSYADHYFILTLIDALRGDGPGGNTWFPTKAESFQSRLSRLWHDSWFCYPVDRSAPGEEVFRKAQEILDQGAALCLYPEGTRGDGAELLPFKSGAFRMALAAGAPVVPIALGNLHRVMPKGARRPSRENGYVVVGEPLTVPDDTSELHKAASQMRDQARERIEQLLAHGATAAADRTSVEAAAAAIARLVHQRLTRAMSEDGRVDDDTADSAALLAELGLRMAPAQVDLLAQQARCRALGALNRPAPVRLVRLAGVAKDVDRVLEDAPDHPFAHYLAGALRGRLPRWAGGSRADAKEHFAQAAQDPALASRSLVALAQQQIAEGDHAGAATSLAAAEQAIATTDARGEIRRNRISRLRSQLTAA